MWTLARPSNGFGPKNKLNNVEFWIVPGLRRGHNGEVDTRMPTCTFTCMHKHRQHIPGLSFLRISWFPLLAMASLLPVVPTPACCRHIPLCSLCVGFFVSWVVVLGVGGCAWCCLYLTGWLLALLGLVVVFTFSSRTQDSQDSSRLSFGYALYTRLSFGESARKHRAHPVKQVAVDYNLRVR